MAGKAAFPSASSSLLAFTRAAASVEERSLINRVEGSYGWPKARIPIVAVERPVEAEVFRGIVLIVGVVLINRAEGRTANSSITMELSFEG